MKIEVSYTTVDLEIRNRPLSSKSEGEFNKRHKLEERKFMERQRRKKETAQLQISRLARVHVRLENETSEERARRLQYMLQLQEDRLQKRKESLDWNTYLSSKTNVSSKKVRMKEPSSLS